MEAEIKPWYKKSWGILLIIFLVFFILLILALGTFFIKLIVDYNNTEAPIISDTSYKENTNRILIEGEDNYWTGSQDAQIVIVEFSDFSCPSCKSSFSTIRALSSANKELVKHIYRDFPVIGDHSLDLALSARCAGEQGLFWPMHDKLFTNQGVKETKEIALLATQIGADTNRFKECVESGKYLEQIQKDYTDGQELGIVGTPTWFINGQKISGDIPPNIFQQIIDQFK